MRILIVTHAPLSPEFGAGQMAINLAEAFLNLGEDVTLWSPNPLLKEIKWWQSMQKMRSKLDQFIQTQKRFDVIDCPAVFITSTVKKSAPIVVARSVQPDLLYLFGTQPDYLQFQSTIKAILSYVYKLFIAFLIVEGWWKADFILCLGSLELRWMQKWFPWWKGKLSYYVNALSKSDQEALAAVRKHRQKPLEDQLRFLWIGRWVSHKGTDFLLNFIEEWLEKRPQDTFTIAGCGAEVEKYLQLELLRAEQIKIVPYFERNQLFSLLDGHDVGLFTSKVEGWGLVLNEMLESGIPVLATNAGGVPNLQPFCQAIKPFNFLLPLPKNCVMLSLDKEEYYARFCWNNIAKNYKNNLLKSEKINKMKKIIPQDNWPDSWKYSYSYDLLEIYGEMSNRGYAYAYGNRRQHTLELIQKVAKPGSKVLDVAAGQGNFSLALAELGYEVTWNDLREELADYVKLKQEKGNINYAPGNILTLNFDSCFDVILIAEVIEHVAHPDEFLKKISQMVKPGGHIVMSTPNGKYFRNHLPKFSEFADPSEFEEIQFQPDADGHIFLLHPDEVKMLTKNVNLLLIEMQLLTNPLTAGYFKFGSLLKLLPPSYVNNLEQVYKKLPTFLVEKLSTCLIALLARPTENNSGEFQ
jgi:2-polyprenyl-3-methyl-5-hydroxy-6-metoxy-1,4-benzoquinol methylase/glycosyltransferase involved in cell wall biosynthesis